MKKPQTKTRPAPPPILAPYVVILEPDDKEAYLTGNRDPSPLWAGVLATVPRVGDVVNAGC
jgi:hypothetical protein